MTGRLHIALMGIDGAGKTTLAVDLAEELRRGGREVRIVNFKRAMLGGDDATRSTLAHVAFASLQSQYVDAIAEDPAVDYGALLTEEDFGPAFPAAENRLRALPVARNSAFPFLSAALLETVGGLWVQKHVDSLLDAGIAVIDESFAFKHAMKNVLMARRMAGDDQALLDAATSALDNAMAVFGSVLRPTLGCWVDTDPALAARWRAASDETTTPFETYGLVGENGDGSFLAMQRDSREVFELAARRWGWSRIEMTDRGREENIGDAVRTITGTPAPVAAGMEG